MPAMASAAQDCSLSGLVLVLFVLAVLLYFVFVLLVRVAIVVFVTPIPDRILVLVQSFLDRKSTRLNSSH